MSDATRLSVAGHDLEAMRVGVLARAPSLVLLHDGLGCVAMWRDFPARLAVRTGCGVLAYSRAGYGGSSPCALPRPLDYMHQEAEQVLPGVLDAAGVGECVLVGHSDGASIAAIHAGRVRDLRVRGLVLVAPHFFTEPVGLAAIARARKAWERGALRAQLRRYHGDNVECAFRGWNDAWLDPAFAAWDIRDALRAVEIPLLVIQGEADEYGTLAQVEAVHEAAGPATVRLLPGCGHSPHRERPTRTLEAIAAFLLAIGLVPGSGNITHAPEEA